MRKFIEWMMPEAASTYANQVDNITYFIMWVSVFFFILIMAAIIVFAIKFKRKSDDDKTSPVDHNVALEVIWTVIPSLLLVVMFVWGFKAYLHMSVPPKGSMEVKVTGQKWFWTFGYPNGHVESGKFVIPVNTPIKALISSKDVLHSMFIPAFRAKMDALPNRYSVTWFEATKTGTYPLYCTEYCGTSHSGMIAEVEVMSKADYQAWLAQSGGPAEGESLANYGESIYTKYACNTCHSLDGSVGNGPSWKGLWQKNREMENGPSIVADENYIRESVLEPQKHIVKGYAPVMPSYQGILKDQEIEGLIEYIKTIK